MATSNAQRQAAYRARHLKDENGKSERLNLIVDLHAKRALERWAKCYGVTQREALSLMIMQAEDAALNLAADRPNGQGDYYGGKLRLKLDGVTQ